MENVFENMFSESSLFSLLGNGAHISSKFENANFMFSMFSFSNVGNDFRWKRGGCLVIIGNFKGTDYFDPVSTRKILFLFMLLLLCSIMSKYHDFLFPFSSTIYIGFAVLCAICIICVEKFKNHLTDYYWINY